ncbi:MULTISPECIES: LuxR C-terminal-related transcriptional regulator [unclassified Streptomyces]|uniref:helix-turn-helix transcriptional regulator n=1 Tax=unclassified Streptomyces TaxID=2593676 RepID=UPI0037F763DA|nr:LuxR C-terminal-related transcriptional regulator [Streptomyces sp. NBC_01014]
MAKVPALHDGERTSSGGAEEPVGRSGVSVRPLRGRTEQTELIGRAFERAQNSRRCVQGWISGPAGIGKSRLLAEARRAASARGFTVIHLEGDEFSPALPMTSLFHALARSLDADRRPSPRRGAREVRDEQRDDRHFHAASLSLLEAQLKKAPLLLTCDEGRSPVPLLAATLHPLMSRLRNSPVVWLTARRTVQEDEPALPGGPDVWPQSPTEALRLPLGPLCDSAVSQLFADCADGRPDAELSTLLGLAQGNPRLLVAVIGQLLEQGDVCVQGGTARLSGAPAGTGPRAGTSASGRAPRWFSALMEDRLATVSPQARLLMEVAAVLGPACLPEDIAEMLGEPVGALVPRFREAVVAGMVKCGTETVTFRHELMRQVLMEDMPGVVRGALHRQALGILLARGHSPTSVAPHLIHGAHRGDPAMAGLLRQAAEESVTNAPQTAADLALRGLELVRPVVDAAHEPLTVIAVEACVRSGTLPTAVTLARDALTRPAGPEITARLRYWLSTALLLLGRTTDCLEVAGELLAQPGVPAHLRQKAVLNQLSAWSAHDGHQVARHAEQALAADGGRGDGSGDGDGDEGLDIQAGVTTALAVLRWREGKLNEALALCQDAVALADRGSAFEWHTHPRLVSAMMLAHTGRFSEAEAALGTTPDPVEFVSADVPRLVHARLRLADGRLDEAEREATAGLAVAEESGVCVFMPLAWQLLATVASHRGELARAGDYARRLRKALPDDRGQVCAAAGAWIEAQIALASGSEPDLKNALEELWSNEPGRGALLIEEPGFAPWLVRVLLATRHPSQAAEVSAAAERLARANPGITVVFAAAEHARGLIEGDADALEEAVAGHRDAWARASAAEDLGALLLETSRARAVRSLESALTLYGQLGAEGDTARVRRRLRAVGIRRRHWSHSPEPQTGLRSLTRTELTVAEHVVQGLTNRQVADRMFLSPHTIAFHMRQIFRKLQVHSRLELARCIQGIGPEGMSPPGTGG